MKVRESGMPPSAVWDSYFEPDLVLGKLGLTPVCHDVVEFGCGYGTFTIPAARRISGTVHTIEIDAAMTDIAAARATASGADNIQFVARDFVKDGTGLLTGSMDFAMVFNILHHDEPVSLMREAYRNLKEGGLVGIIHWNFDPETLSGPPMEIRPRPAQCLQWALQAGFAPRSDILALPPNHYGLVLSRPGPGEQTR